MAGQPRLVDTVCISRLDNSLLALWVRCEGLGGADVGTQLQCGRLRRPKRSTKLLGGTALRTQSRLQSNPRSCTLLRITIARISRFLWGMKLFIFTTKDSHTDLHSDRDSDATERDRYAATGITKRHTAASSSGAVWYPGAVGVGFPVGTPRRGCRGSRKLWCGDSPCWLRNRECVAAPDWPRVCSATSPTLRWCWIYGIRGTCADVEGLLWELLAITPTKRSEVVCYAIAVKGFFCALCRSRSRVTLCNACSGGGASASIRVVCPPTSIRVVCPPLYPCSL